MRSFLRRFVSMVLSMIMVLSLFSGITLHVKAEEDNYPITCTEKEAYEKGFEYYKAWYTCDRGNWALLTFGWKPVYESIVTKNRNDPAYQYELWGWRSLTFDLSDTLLHSNTEKTYCEELLFNLLYDENSQTMPLSALTDCVDVNGNIVTVEKALEDIYDQTGITEWAKMTKILDWLDDTTMYDAEDLEKAWEFADSAKQFSDFSKGLGYVAKGADVIGNFGTLFEYFENVSKIGALAGTNEDISEILSDMKSFTDNDAYKSSLGNFSDYLRVTFKDLDPAMYTSSFVSRKFIDETVNTLFSAVCKKAFPGLNEAVALGKFGAEMLNGQDSKYKKFNELEVYYDIDHLLRREVDQIVYDVDDGSIAAAEKFNVAYNLLKNMYNVGVDCYKEYVEAMYKKGLLNEIFPGVNSSKYETIMTNVELTRDEVNGLFEADELNAKDAYEAAKEKYDPDVKKKNVIKVPEVQDNEAANREGYNQHAPEFCFVVDSDFTIKRDLESYGAVKIDDGTFNINGHNLTIYGDLIINGGTITGSGVIDVKGDIKQYGGTVNVPGGSTLKTEGEYIQEKGALHINGGKLTVGGSHTIGTKDTERGSRELSYSITETGAEVIGGDFLAYTLSSNYSSYVMNTLSSGSLTVGGNLRVLSGTPLNGGENFALNLKGSGDLTLQNISGGNVMIENAATRKITFKDMVHATSLGGGDMTVTPDNLDLAGKLNNDLTVNGDAKLTYYSSGTANGLNLNNHNLTVNGNFTNAGEYGNSNISVSGTMKVTGNLIQEYTYYLNGISIPTGGILDISGDYDQKGGMLKVSGGMLKIGGDHVISKASDSSSRTMGYTVTDGGTVEIAGDLLAETLCDHNTAAGSYNNFASGSMTVGGNVEIKSGSPLNGGSDFTLTLKGTDDLILQNIGGGNVVIENASDRKITFKDKVHVTTLDGGDMTVTADNLGFEGKLLHNLTVNGDVKADYNSDCNVNDLNLNKHNLTVNGNLTHSGDYYNHTISVSGTLEVKGNLTQEYSYYKTSITIPTGGTLDITGDYDQKGGTLNVSGGTLKVGGDHVIRKASDSSSRTMAYTVTDGGTVDIAGDLLAETLCDHNTAAGSYNNFNSGSMTVGGNVEIQSGSPMNAGANFTLNLKGSDDLILQNIDGGNVVIENAADRGITFKDTVAPSLLDSGNLAATGENLTFGGKLAGDLSVTGDMTIKKDTNLNGHSLTVSGNVLQSAKGLIVNGGTFDIGGNYAIAALTGGEYTKADYAYLNMSKAADRVNVGGNMIVNTNSSCTLKDGVLSIKGDFTQIGTANKSNFKASGNHLTILDGENLQRITFGTYPDSAFNKLELHSFPEDYIFSPEEAGASATVYCPHEHTEVRDAVAAGCTENGYTGDVYCQDCGALLESGTTIAATGHTWVIDQAVAATCVKGGKTEGRHCSSCGYVAVKQTIIPAKGHTAEWEITKEATCTEDGKKENICKTCHETLEEEVIPATGHQGEWKVTKEATCTEDGKRELSCEVCGDFVTETIPATGHSWGEAVTTKEATCTEAGEKTVTCEKCGETQVEEIPATGHKFEADQEFCLNGCGTANPDYTAPVVVEPQPQEIIVDAKTYNKVFGAAAFSLGAKAKTKITYKSSNTKVATVSTAGKVTLKGIGTAVITLNAPADDTYLAAKAVKVSINVKPKGTTIAKLTPAAKAFTAKWKKQAVQTTGYQIQYSTVSTFKSYTNVTVKGATTVSKKITKLKANKKYYVRIRTYKTVDGKKIYSSWSKKYTVKTK